VFLLISGGIGITPLQSLYHSLIVQSESGRSLRKVVFAWSIKDRALVDAMGTAGSNGSKGAGNYLPLSFQPPVMESPMYKTLHVVCACASVNMG
jgi:hypothetical protein